MKTRSIPASVAPLLQELELEQPKVVTRELLVDLISRTDLELPPEEAAARLQRHGWLLSLRTRGAWEFAPASRAGPTGAGDPFIELRATLARRPNLDIAVAYESAVWLLDMSQRAPSKHVLAINRQKSIPFALRDFRVTRSRWMLKPVLVDGLPVWRLETLLVSIAGQPDSFRDWPNIMDWLPEADEMDASFLEQELAGRPRSAWMRVGYLLESAGVKSIARSLHDRAPSGSGPFYLGSRDRPGHYDRFWEVRDSILHRKHIRSSRAGQ